MRISLQYLGCRVNQSEIAEMERSLRLGGHEIVGLDDDPEVCIVNTCTVTSKSDYQSRQLVRKAARAGAKVIATGCYAQLNRENLESIEGVQDVVDNSNKHTIINQFINNCSGIALSGGIKPQGKSKYYLKVQDGCDNSCTYCRVWMARGRSRSEGPEKIVERAIQAEQSGYREIVLTGIHLGLYGKGRDVSLSGLLERLIAGTQHCRFRLSSLETTEVDDALIDLMGDGRVCGHLHIPLQSGSDNVLKDMGRHYSSGEFVNRINQIHARLGSIGLGTDIIAGFPTEREQDFQDTVRLAKELPFSYMHIFPYSNRPGTVASGLTDVVGGETRKKRAGTLRSISADKARVYRNSMIKRTLNVLVESKNPAGMWQGTSDNFIKVELINADSQGSGIPDTLKGHIVAVKVCSTENQKLLGIPII